MNDKNKRIVLTILLIAIILFTIVSGTFAFWFWDSTSNERTNVVFTSNRNFSCAADGGGSFDSRDNPNMLPSTCTDPDKAIQRKIVVTPTIYEGNLSIYMDLWLDINTIGPGLASSENFRYALTDSADGCDSGNVYSYGNFQGLTDGDRVQILDGMEYARNLDSTTEYYLYIWIDDAQKTPETQNQEFSFSLNGECTDKPGPNKPVLDEGMIPVTISDDGTVTTISADDPDWYNYDEKKWANVVLVNKNATDGVTDSQSRSYYLENLSNNVVVNESDILAYYVWIPRYKYKLFRDPPVASGEANAPVSIEVKFESKYIEKSNGTNVGEYLTHPAFTFGDQELSGIWVGKFETTGSDVNPTILPNMVPLTGQRILEQFITSLAFSGGRFFDSNSAVTFKGSSFYGLTENVDSHMMKNSEWGAVAYLSHSKYGKNGQVHSNPHDMQDTGCGTLEPVGSMESSCDISYGYDDPEYPQSTTGNITGIFDMSGSEAEAVMANYNNYSGYNSGFDGIDADGNEIDDTFPFPDEKYYDLYLDSFSLCTVETCGGHALYETFGWYGDFGQFVKENDAWLARGYYYYPHPGIYLYSDTGEYYGIFNFSDSNGSSEEYFTYAWRSVLVTE